MQVLAARQRTTVVSPTIPRKSVLTAASSRRIIASVQGPAAGKKARAAMYRHVLCVYPYRVEPAGARYWPPVGLEMIAAAPPADPDEQDRIHRRLTEIFRADLPVTRLFPYVTTVVAHWRIRGLSSPYRINPVWFMEELWLENEP